MPLPRPRPSLGLPVRMLMTGLLLAACSSPTDVDPVTVSLRTIVFATQEEREEWPSSPTIDGGESLMVRAMAFVGCGSPEAEVRRRDNVVGLEIRAVDTDRMCLGIVAAWQPIEATVSGLAPGTYRVRVGIAGLSQRAEGTIQIVPR